MRAASSIAEIPRQIAQQERKTLRKPPQEHVAAIITASIIGLGAVFGMWFDVSTQPSVYPYYDMQKPVAPWSEPTPIEGNHDRGGDYK